MSIVRHTCILLCWMLLTSIIVSCDPFHEDEIADGKVVTINPERTEYYLPDYLYPNPSVVINLGEIVMFTFETISIRVTEYPTYGRVFSLSDFLVKYTPSKAFFEDAPHEGERKDQFGISIFKDGKIIATQTITVRMDDFPCSLYAVEDKIATTRETAVSFLVTWNDRLCDIRSDNIEYSIALAPQHGRAELNGSTFTYTPDAGYQGEDEFVYQLKAFRQENMVSVGPLISYGLVTIDVGE